MVFYGSGEVRPGIEEACNLCVVVGEELHDCDNMFFFCSCRVITLAYRFGKMVLVTAITDAIYL